MADDPWWWVEVRRADSYILFQGRFRGFRALDALELAMVALMAEPGAQIAGNVVIKIDLMRPSAPT